MMTPKQLYEFAQKYGLEDAILSYPLYDREDLIADVNMAKVVLTSESEKPMIVLVNEIKTD